MREVTPLCLLGLLLKLASLQSKRQGDLYMHDAITALTIANVEGMPDAQFDECEEVAKKWITLEKNIRRWKKKDIEFSKAEKAMADIAKMSVKKGDA